jgi:hypothetical protein
MKRARRASLDRAAVAASLAGMLIGDAISSQAFAPRGIRFQEAHLQYAIRF